MSTITLTATQICSGGNHVSIRLDLDGTPRYTKTYEISELVDAINDADADDVVRVLLRIHKIGKTNAQVKTDLLAGIIVIA